MRPRICCNMQENIKTINANCEQISTVHIERNAQRIPKKKERYSSDASTVHLDSCVSRFFDYDRITRTTSVMDVAVNVRQRRIINVH